MHVDKMESRAWSDDKVIFIPYTAYGSVKRTTDCLIFFTAKLNAYKI